jgi:hypothetical protein
MKYQQYCPPAYTVEEIMRGELTLDQLLDSPWSEEGRTLRQVMNGVWPTSEVRSRTE